MNQNNQPNTNQESSGWGRVQINAQMPLNAIVDFLNILNQRIYRLERIIEVEIDNNGTTMSLAQIDELNNAQRATENKGE